MVAHVVELVRALGGDWGGILAGIILTGIFLVIRNLENIWFPPGFIIFLDIMHLGLVMAFLVSGLYCLIAKKQWTRPRRIG